MKVGDIDPTLNTTLHSFMPTVMSSPCSVIVEMVHLKCLYFGNGLR